MEEEKREDKYVLLPWNRSDTMRLCLLIYFFIFSANAFAQEAGLLTPAQRFVQEEHIRINSVTPPPGFQLFYGCDSFLFMRGDFGDTIKILTPGMSSRTSMAEFRELMKSPSYGVTTFAGAIMDDSDLWVHFYHSTTFLRRHDSLFELVDTLSYPELYDQLLACSFDDNLSDQERRTLDSIENDHDARSRSAPKLIFTPKAFTARKTIRFPRRLNSLGDMVKLEVRQRHGKRWWYVIRIENKMKDGTETSYSYSFDDRFRFTWWEGCPAN
ncbi:MAG: hypothetical protein EOO15_11385 [Chitinophagaceae bacterium]|nr:MAG: hypothetical protein EOO15_11385 [Chitinophagaceae bacterium]